MTYHARGSRGRAPIRVLPTVVQWIITVLAIAAAVGLFVQATRPDAAPELMLGAWATASIAGCCLLTAIGMVCIDGMRRLALLASPLALITGGLIGSAFTTLAWIVVLFGALWLAVALVREGSTPYYLR
ncbi:hypothetical protein ACFPVT_01105 [Corynebacterium choanae]|uniref:Uncharacterized protein n=1 Tax=Corynebacterium choanae TaxID=1862358 RepID=A0A3G6J9C5_9CORY|nr:hypothetical protein [Corynebacterium choanae]AZA13050.1 hypothetical protein CCHOA_03190 [Corynebacterium choanae]